jgi:hypothetical protein
MYIPGEVSPVWDLHSEDPISSDDPLRAILENELGVAEWVNEFDKKYRQWLDDESKEVYDIFHEVNLSMIKKLDKYNNTASEKVYYWFDVDRVEQPDFNWKKCPLSNSELIDLGEMIPNKNRLMSKMHSIIVPFG